MMTNRKQRYGKLVRGWDWRTTPERLAKMEAERKRLGMNKTEYLEYCIDKEIEMFHITPSKLAEVVRIFNSETDPQATAETIKSEIVADWHNADEHQDWLNTADPEEIADWLASFYQ